MRRFFKSLANSDAVKSTAILVSGTVLSQVFSLLAAPISSRVFLPEHYGALGIYMGITSILGTLTYSHYPQAILIAKQDEEARNLIWFSWAVATAITLLITLGVSVVWAFTTWLDELGFWTLTIPVSIMLNAITTALMVWANRTKQYKIISRNRIAQTIITIIIQLGVGYFIHREYGLMAGLLTGQLMSAILLIRPFLFREGVKIGRPDVSFFRTYAHQYRQFILFATPSDFINNLINQLPVYFLNSMAGLSFVGNYAFAQRILGLPSAVIGSSIADVFRQKASQLYLQNGECRDLFRKTARTLFMIGIGPLILMILFAPSVFAFIFGEQWRAAGEMARILSPLFFLRIIVSPLSYLYTLAGHLREDLATHVISIGVIATGFAVTNHFFDNKNLLIAGYTLAYMLIYLIYLTRSWQMAQGKPTTHYS